MKTVLFDLDGTLLPMDQDVFVKYYFGGLAKKLAPLGYDPKTLVEAVWAGTKAMSANDGSVTNAEAFWRCFTAMTGTDARKDEDLLLEYYRTEFQQVRQVCGFDSRAATIVRGLKARGCRVALATNPLFPVAATDSRIRWTGLEPEDFDVITTYEDARYCKPNPAYYRAVLDALGEQPENCIMVGNDAEEDMAAEKLGMQVFLLTDCLLNRKNLDISSYPQGGFKELMDFLTDQVGINWEA